MKTYLYWVGLAIFFPLLVGLIGIGFRDPWRAVVRAMFFTLLVVLVFSMGAYCFHKVFFFGGRTNPVTLEAEK